MTSSDPFTDSREELIRLILKQIESSIGSASHMEIQNLTSNGFSVQVGSSPKAVVTVSVSDPKIPSFAATFPSLVSRRTGEMLEECTSDGLLALGVVWVIRKVFRYGFVPPEGYRKKQKNRGRPKRQSS